MEAIKSPLVLENFFLLNQDYHFIQPNKNKKVDAQKIMDDYTIDIDFTFQQSEKDVYQLFTKVNVNNVNNPLSGYVLFAEGVSIFSLKKSGLSEKDISQLLHFSGLNISINSLRNIIATITSNGPFGRYLLPAIDVNHLLKQKYSKGNE